MTDLRITKYNPINRDSSGKYIADEWTSVSDIGQTFSKKIFDVDEYLRIEKNYVNAAVQMVEEFQVSNLRIVEIEEYRAFNHLPHILVESTQYLMESFSSDIVIGKNNIQDIIRLVLRELIWCKVIGDEGFYIHFGYDYYMYIGSDRESDIKWEKLPGVFVEQFNSPYSS